MDDGLEVLLFGRPQVRLNDAPLTGLAYQKSLGLLFYLAATERSHTRPDLAGLLWGDTTDANALGGLRKILAELRQYMSPYLIVTRHEVALNCTPPHYLDVRVYRHLVERTTKSLARDGALTDADAERLEQAVRLYRGDFLKGFSVHQAPMFEEWVLLARERLRLSLQRALCSLSDHYAACGAYGLAIAHTERLLALAPEQEEAHRQMMSLLAIRGQRGAALRQYETCRDALAREFGVAPARETTDLYVRIRDSVAPPPASLSSRRDLPVPLLPLLGRQVELETLLGYLQDPTCREITLLGPGGSGKTHLALEAARACRDARARTAFEDGVCFVPLASVRSIKAIVPAVAQSLGFGFCDDRAPRRQLAGYLRDRHLLLILDSFEHLLGGVGLLRECLTRAPSVKTLVTSRVRLNLRGERLLPVAGLICPDENSQRRDACRSAAAVQLFVQTARRIRPGFEATDEAMRDIARICRYVEGLPLAILLAASWMRVLTPAEIASRLDRTADQLEVGSAQGLDLLETNWRDVPERQRSMRAVFDQSWDLLTGCEQQVLASLSRFRGDFTLGAAREVSGGSLRELMSLADQSLLQPSGPGRYAMHELLKQYLAQKLEAGDNLPIAHSSTLRTM